MIAQPILPIWLVALLLVVCGVAIVLIILPQKHNKKFVKMWLRRFVVLLLVAVMAIRPSIPGQSRYTGNALIDVYFAVDNSVSMRAVDTGDERSRLELAKADIQAIAEKIPGARYSVIGFSNDATQELPLTNDATALASTASILQTTSRYDSSGTSIDRPLEYLEDELERNFDTTPDRGRLLFYLGDGEQTVESAPKSFEPLERYLSGGYVLGYGSELGEKMLDDKWGDDSAEDSFIMSFGEDDQDRRDNFAITRIDQQNLKQIATQTGLSYSHRTAENDSVQAIVENINVGEISRSSREVDTYLDLYWIVALPIIPLILPDLLSHINNLKGARRALRRGGWRG